MASQADVVLRFFLDERSEADVARLLGISNVTLRRWVKRGVPKREADRVQLEYKVNQQLDQIEANFTDAQECVRGETGHSPLVRVVRNRDNSIDAQLTVYDIPRGQSVKDTILIMSECTVAVRNLLDSYLQMGMRWGQIGGERTDSGDRRVRGMSEAVTHWYRSELFGNLFVYARSIQDNVEAKRRNRKIQTVFLRGHWNPSGLDPDKWSGRYKRKAPRAPRKGTR